MRVTADDTAPEGEGHDAWEHVLVDAGELLGLDRDAGLFQDFPGRAFRGRLGQFQHATWRHPAAVIASLDGQDPPVVTEHDPGDADRVTGQLGHPNPLTPLSIHRESRPQQARQGRAPPIGHEAGTVILR